MSTQQAKYGDPEELEIWTDKIREIYNSKVAAIFKDTIAIHFVDTKQLIDLEFGDDFSDDEDDLTENSIVVNAITNKLAIDRLSIDTNEFYEHYQSIVRGIDSLVFKSKRYNIELKHVLCIEG